MTSTPVKPVSQAHVTVSAFDVHLWSKSFDPDHFNPKVHFLWSEPDYRAMRTAGQKIDLKKLVLFPLKDEVDAKRNHFWWRYDTAVDNLAKGAPTPLGDVRAFLWPLRCRPKDFKLTFGISKASVPPKVWTTIWLWPFGWSSTIEFKLTAPFSLDDLEALGATLRSASPPPFAFNGKALSLSDIFRQLADMVRQDIAIPGKVPGDVTHLNRHVVMSLELPRGMQVPGSGWSAADQLRMLAALRGDKVPRAELLSADILSTPLGGRNFAFTDFNEGTLLVLRHWKDRETPATRETNHCLFANLRTFSVVYFALRRFSQYAKDRPDVASAVTNAKNLLSSLPNEYRNGLCANFKKHYAPLR